MATLADKLSRGASAHPSAVAVEGSEPDEILALLRQAVARRRAGRIRLPRRRRRPTAGAGVDPLRIESMDADWYLRGWCHLREGVRTFRLDRISALTLTDAPVTDRADRSALPGHAVRTLGERHDSGRSRWRPPPCRCSPTTSPDARARCRPTGARVHHLGRPLPRPEASGGRDVPVVTVIEPADARRAVAQWAAAGAARYAADTQDTDS